MKKILYVSPHLDDALLSMAQNIKNEIDNGEEVAVVSVFTEGDAVRADFYEKRRCDDIRALTAIGAKYQHLGMVDSYFRGLGYCNYSTIMFHSEVAETELFDAIFVSISKLIKNYDICYFPLGVGGHVDHNIVFRCAEKLMPKFADKIDFRFYADMPYCMLDGNVDIRIWQTFGIKPQQVSIKPLLENDYYFLQNYCSDVADSKSSASEFAKEVDAFSQGRLTLKNDYFPVRIPVKFDKAELLKNYASEVEDLFGERTEQALGDECYFMFRAKNSVHYLRNDFSDVKNYCARIESDCKGTRLVTDAIFFDDNTLPIYDQVYFLFEKLRVLGCMYNLNPQGFKNSFQAEDIFEAEVFYPADGEDNHAFLKRFVPRLVAPNCELRFTPSTDAKLGISANFQLKSVETPSGKKYQQNENGLIQCESFEVHISEHCNLRCVQCCNVSPFNKPKFLAVEDVDNQFSFLRKHLNPDVIKISGGEPLLNPQLGDIIGKIKEIFPDTPLRITTNGLLINRLPEETLARLDQLWVSNYSSMPNPPKNIERIFALARKYEIVLNIKDVTEFSSVLPKTVLSPTEAEDSFRNCWMRHRCLMIRNDRFYKCTRAAYIDDYLRTTQNLATDFSIRDGIPLSAENFNEKALELLNGDTPIDSCVYCLGNTGGSFRQRQMER